LEVIQKTLPEYIWKTSPVPAIELRNSKKMFTCMQASLLLRSVTGKQRYDISATLENTWFRE
jgi:hypothetical protein